jgi:hypothetical protein
VLRDSSTEPRFPSENRLCAVKAMRSLGHGVGEIVFDHPNGLLAIGRERQMRDQGVGLARNGREGRGTLGDAFLQVDTMEARL